MVTSNGLPITFGGPTKIPDIMGSPSEMTIQIVYSQLKVFIPARWNHAQVFRDLGVAPIVQIMGFLRAETSSRHLTQQLQWGLHRVRSLK